MGEKERRRAKLLRDTAKDLSDKWENFRQTRIDYLSALSIQGLTVVLVSIEIYRLIGNSYLQVLPAALAVVGVLIVSYSSIKLHSEYKALRYRTKKYSESTKESMMDFMKETMEDLEENNK